MKKDFICKISDQKDFIFKILNHEKKLIWTSIKK